MSLLLSHLCGLSVDLRVLCIKLLILVAGYAAPGISCFLSAVAAIPNAIFRLAFRLAPAIAWRSDFTRAKSAKELREQVLA
jgi:hypothetical protein